MEVLTSLTTDEFMMAIERFIAIRGTPRRIISDGALTFKGSERFLQNKEEVSTEKIEHKYTSIQWIWNPPYNPSAGGLFERMVKSTKEAIAKLWKGSHPSNTHLRTLTSIVMARLNERPLSPLSQPPEDMEVLTPCLLYTSPSPRDKRQSRMPSSA